MSPFNAKFFHKNFLVLCCILATSRVAFYCLSFPFFCNVDEEAHFDLAVKYSQAQMPTNFDRISAEAAAVIAQFASPEFFMKKQDYSNQQFPPPNSNKIKLSDSLAHNRHYWHSIYNHESSGPPLYYMLAGAWLRIGIVTGICHFNQLWMLYWIRLLNVLFIFLMVVLAYKITQLIFHSSPFAAHAAALIVALLPQDIFYSIQSDVASPVCFGACLYYYLRFTAEKGTRTAAILSGVFLAATVLCKNGNLILAPFMIVFSAIQTFLYAKTNSTVSAPSKFIFFVTAALFLLTLWVSRNIYYFGDWLATEEKTRILGWKVKQFSDWMPHQLFTMKGLENWLSELLASFWRGEFTWERERITDKLLDTIYWILSVVITVLFTVCVIKYRRLQNGIYLILMGGAWLVLLAFIFFLSVRYDFTDCFYPTKDNPYFTSGRLISAGIIPFAIMFASLLFARNSSQKKQFILLAVLAAFFTIVSIREYQLSLPAINSAFNLKHEKG